MNADTRQQIFQVYAANNRRIHSVA